MDQMAGCSDDFVGDSRCCGRILVIGSANRGTSNAAVPVSIGSMLLACCLVDLLSKVPLHLVAHDRTRIHTRIICLVDTSSSHRDACDADAWRANLFGWPRKLAHHLGTLFLANVQLIGDAVGLDSATI